MAKITCPKCHQARAQSACHCMVCHRSFTSLTAFDAHQRADQCTIDGPKWRQRDDGAWTNADKFEAVPW